MHSVYFMISVFNWMDRGKGAQTMPWAVVVALEMKSRESEVEVTRLRLLSYEQREVPLPLLPCSRHLGKSFKITLQPHQQVSTLALYRSFTSPYDTVKMFRTALLRSAQALAQTSTRAAAPAVRTAAIRSPFITSRVSSPATSISAVRCYASGSGLGQEEVTGRILDLLKNFDKVRYVHVRSI